MNLRKENYTRSLFLVMSRFNNFYNNIFEKREGETDEEAYKRQMAGIEKLKQMSQIKKNIDAAGNTQDARLRGLQDLVNTRYGKANNTPQTSIQQQPQAAAPVQPAPIQTQAKQTFDPKKFDDIDNEVGASVAEPRVQPTTIPAPATNTPLKARSKEEIKSQFNQAYVDALKNRNSQQTQTAALPPPAQTSIPAAAPKVATPVSKKPVDATKITKQYDTMSKIASDPNAPEGEKAAAQKKMSEFEKKYQDIINKYKTPPATAAAKPTVSTPPPAAAPAPGTSSVPPASVPGTSPTAVPSTTTPPPAAAPAPGTSSVPPASAPSTITPPPAAAPTPIVAAEPQPPRDHAPAPQPRPNVYTFKPDG